MPKRTAEAAWMDGIRRGQGEVELGSGTWEGEYSFKSRFRDDDQKSNPEELVCAGLASCVSMAVANRLEQAATTPENVQTTVSIEMVLDNEMGPTIDRVEVRTEVHMQADSSDRVTRIATQAQETCPVSRLLGGAKLDFDVTHTE